MEKTIQRFHCTIVKIEISILYHVIVNSQWTDCIIDKIFKNVEIVKFITTALKSVLKLVKLQSLVAKCCKMQKIQPVKFANFVYFCITRGKLIPLSRKRYQFSPRNTKVYKICKLCSSTKFRMLFNAVVMNFTISKFLKILSMMQSVH